MRLKNAHKKMRHGNPAPAPLSGSTIYLDRELSLLAFNRRVLAQAEDPAIPLLERLRYLCIVSSNLDEFFEVRVASLRAQGGIDGDLAGHPGLLASLERISGECHQLVEKQYAILNQEVLPQLSANGVHLLRHTERNEVQRAWVKEYFDREVRPLLTPIGLDPSHPFPQVINKSLNFIIALSGKDAFGRGTAIAIVKAPRVLPRVIRLPDALSNNGVAFCLLSSIIHAHISDLFTGREVIAYSQFRLTRDSDLWVDEEEVKNLRQALQGELQSRQFGAAVRLEVAKNSPDNLAQFLLDQFALDKSNLYPVDGPVNMVRLSELIEHVKLPSLRFEPFMPGTPSRLLANGDIFQVLRKQDILIHHPFQSFQTVVDFIRTAAYDPHVVALKQTIYRTGMSSDLMESLITAARLGKEVTVIVELKARFDEAANINWADRLEQAGAQVVYGVVGLKTHAKLALVIRRDGGALRYYAHLGTGNYHPTTTKHYTDFGLLTAHPELAAEVNEVFIHLTSLTKPKKLNHLWLAPFALHAEFIRAIRNEARIARLGRPARIIAKMNSLVDESVIRALYAASGEGVRIDLIVRGACSLRPGVAGLSENIKVRSIVGRFLEHSRIYYFRNDLAHDIYLSSADWMSRNLFRRIEVAFPVLDKSLKKRVIQEGLTPYLKDNHNAWELDSDGHYKRRKPRGKQAGFSAQQHLMLTLGANLSGEKG
jgi:polyphosphate kinase